MSVLKTERLTLRPWEHEDADFLLDLEGRWGVERYLGDNPSTLRSHEEASASIMRRQLISEYPIHGIWIITDAEGNRLGNLLLKPTPLSAGQEPAHQPEVEIGWHLHPDAWGHGYATEAAAAVITDAFERGQHRIIAVTHPQNTASQTVCTRLGMYYRRQVSRYMDSVCELFEIERDTRS